MQRKNDEVKNMKPKALVLTGFGINCDYETKYALELAGFSAERLHINDLISSPMELELYQLIAVPGGFSFGDDIASGKVLANKLKYGLEGPLSQFIADGKLMIGICNGFQAMVKFGLLPAFGKDYRTQSATLTFNDSGRFEDRWVYLKTNKDSKCIFTKGIGTIYLPVRHGEGKFYMDSKEKLAQLEQGGHIAFQYSDAKGIPTQAYPLNPNGSISAIAGICDETGRIFGLMPHPEAYVHKTHHPRWSRENVPEEGMGLAIFKNAAKYIQEKF